MKHPKGNQFLIERKQRTNITLPAVSVSVGALVFATSMEPQETAFSESNFDVGVALSNPKLSHGRRKMLDLVNKLHSTGSVIHHSELEPRIDINIGFKSTLIYLKLRLSVLRAPASHRLLNRFQESLFHELLGRARGMQLTSLTSCVHLFIFVSKMSNRVQARQKLGSLEVHRLSSIHRRWKWQTAGSSSKPVIWRHHPRKIRS